MAPLVFQFLVTFSLGILFAFPPLLCDGDSASDLPKGCIFYRGVVLCKNLTSIPKDLPSYTEILALQGGSLRQLSGSDFNYLENLFSLVLQGVELSDVTGVFGGDRNRRLSTLVFQRTSLSEIPNVGDTIRRLEISSASMTRLNTGNLVNSQLTSLILSRNQFDLDPDSLHGLPDTLTELDLSNCSISTIKEGFCPKLHRLTKLKISAKTISSRAFSTLPGLTNLTLDCCEIKSFAFDNLRNIKSFSIQASSSDPSCKLVLNKYSFSGMDYLSTLRLNYCRLETIPTKAFSGLLVIRQIKIRHNPLRSVMQGAFDGLDTLERVSISKVTQAKSERSIVLMGDNTFSYANLSHVRSIDVSNLNLWNITLPTFRNLPQLEKIHINGNMLHFLQNGTLSNLPNLNSVTLGDNPWNCDCNLRWLKEMIDVKPELFEDIPSVRCSSPENVKGMLFSNLTPDDFICNSIFPI